VANLAGWTAFDVGLYPAARDHLARALDRARQAALPSLTANVLYRAGRVHLHRGMTQEALRFFQLGQLAAQDSGSRRTVAMLCANIAWAYAVLGDDAQAGAHLARAADEFTRESGRGTGDADRTDRADQVGGGGGADGEPWAQFFGEADIAALSGVTQLALSRRSPARIAAARSCLERSVAERGPGMARSLAFEQGALASACLLDRDWEATAAIGEQALAQARQLRSRRVLDRLRPLGALAAACTDAGSGPAAVRDLGHRIGEAVRVP
jgi:tetratricopeptide (TPR) repeat protein